MKEILSNELPDNHNMERQSVREGYFAILNATSDKKIARVYVKHSSNAFPDKDISYEVKDLGQLILSEKIWFPYETSTYDYWYIEVDCYQPGNKSHILKFKTKPNFYCSVVAKDNGLVLISIYLNESNEIPQTASYAKVDFSESSGCTVSLNYEP